MLKVGITGGIGSGKTTVCKIFEILNIPVYYADHRAKWLMVNDPELVAKIKNTFGPDTYLPDGRLNRTHLANIVFNNQQKLNQLNSLVHPAVARDSEQWHNDQEGAPYTLKEAALLIEAGQYKVLDKLIVVVAPKEWRIQKIMERDHTTRQQVEARIDKQLSDEEKLTYADFVIHNGEGKSLIKQVLEVHRLLTSSRLPVAT